MQSFNMRNFSELPDDLLVKIILSLLPTKETAATSVLSKGWSSLWKQQDVVYVELCKKCSNLWVFFILSLHSVFNRVFGGIYLEKGIPLVPENMDFVSFSLFLKVQECSECKGMMHRHKKVTIFIIREWGKTHAVIWTVLEEKQECQIEYIISRGTKLKYCILLFGGLLSICLFSFYFFLIFLKLLVYSFFILYDFSFVILFGTEIFKY